MNVKPADRLSDPQVREALAWPGQLFQARGWEPEIWSGDDPVLLANVRFLAGYRRPGLLRDSLLDEVVAAVRPGDTIGGVTGRVSGASTPGEVKAAVLRLLWQQRLAANLHGRLDADSALEVTA